MNRKSRELVYASPQFNSLEPCSQRVTLWIGSVL